MSDTEIGLCVVVAGNPIDGIKLYGPFHNGPEAVEWADFHMSESFWVAPIEEAKRDND